MKTLFSTSILLFCLTTHAQKDTFSITQINAFIQKIDSFDIAGEYENALTAAIEGTEYSEQHLGKNNAYHAYFLSGQGWAQKGLRNYEESEKLLLKALAIQESLSEKENDEYNNTLIKLGRLYENMKLYENAENSFLASIKHTEKIYGKNHQNHISALHRLADFHKELDRYEESKERYLELLIIVKHKYGREHKEYAKVLQRLAGVERRLGQYKEAKAMYLEAMGIIEKTLGKENKTYASYLRNFSNLYILIGEYEEAEKLLLESLAIREKIYGKEHESYASSLNGLAGLYGDIGDFPQAEKYYLEAIKIRKLRAGINHRSYTSSVTQLGVLYKNMGEYEKAESLYLESLELTERNFGENSRAYATNLNSLANLYEIMGNYKKAEAFHLEALEVKAKVTGKHHTEYAGSLNNLGILYRKTGRYKEAEKLFLEAMGIREKTIGKKHHKYAGIQENLANLYEKMCRYEAAELLYEEAGSTLKHTMGDDHPRYANVRENLANLYRRAGKYAKAEQLHMEALAIRRKIQSNNHPHYAENLNSLIKLYIKSGELKKVSELYLEKGEIEKRLLVNACRHLSEDELEAYIYTFYNKQNLLYSTEQIHGGLMGATYNNALFFKGFLLNTTGQVRKMAQTNPTSLKLYNELKSYHQRLGLEYAKPVGMQKEVTTLEAEVNRLEKELSRIVVGYGEAFRQVNWQEVQQKLKHDEAAIEFVHYNFLNPEKTDSTMYAALVITTEKDQPTFIPLFEEKVFMAFLGNRGKNNKDFVNNLYALNKNSTFKLIWEPIEKELPHVKTIYYSTSGLLHQLNVAAIVDNNNQTIGEKYNLHQLNSTRQLVIQNPSYKSEKSASIFGGIQFEIDSTDILDPTFNDTDYSKGDMPPSPQWNSANSIPIASRGNNWSHLPWTEVEATSIQFILEDAGFNAKTITGNGATEETFKSIDASCSPRILHIATHGFFFPDPIESQHSAVGSRQSDPIFKVSDHPMIRSGLIMAGGNYAWKNGKPFKPNMEDGILTAYEISQMNLSNTELVVLSACETGLGDIEGNEGVYGLQRAFKIAGAKYLIMSLWQVPDFQTQELMTAFYTHWLENKKEIPDAFRVAQKEMREKYEESYLWAGFVLLE